MPHDETTRATPDEKVVHQARAWRVCDREAVANRCDATSRAEYFARQKLREAVDMLEKKSVAG